MTISIKNIIWIILLFISPITCFGQSYFFYILNNSRWVSFSNYTDSVIKTSERIELDELIHCSDSLRRDVNTWSFDRLKRDVSIWSFKDGILSITYYDHQLKTENPLLNYKYETNVDKGVLRIIQKENNVLIYVVHTDPTGTYATLWRQKDESSAPSQIIPFDPSKVTGNYKLTKYYGDNTCTEKLQLKNNRKYFYKAVCERGRNRRYSERGTWMINSDTLTITKSKPLKSKTPEAVKYKIANNNLWHLYTDTIFPGALFLRKEK